MAEVWQWLGSLFSAEGRSLMITVMRWIMVYVIPLVAAYMVGGHLVDRKIRRLSSLAGEAVRAGRHEEALKGYARCAYLIHLFESLYGRRWSVDEWNEPLGDLFSSLGKHSTAAYFYTREVLRQLKRDDFRTYLEHPAALTPGTEITLHDAILYEKLGKTLLEADCAEEAIVWLRRAASAYEHKASTWALLGEAYKRTGNQRLAEEAQGRAASSSDVIPNDTTG
ncbi:MAG: hypothetical protein KatS3mg023_2521 [Armatimonadota bacterium]|nr:MAG: hypothetical protein KatS3mg023_2521 [Armatimonadota bacterium]